MRNFTQLFTLFVAIVCHSLSAYEVTFKSGKTINCSVLEYEDGKLTLADEKGEIRTGSIQGIERIRFTQNDPTISSRDSNSTEDTVAPLEGQDLIAWKLARNAAQERAKKWRRGMNPVPSPFGSKERDRIRHSLKVKPTPNTNFMRRTETGDWIFLFPAKQVSTVRTHEDKIKSFKTEWKSYKVQVTDYGNEIRIESVTLEDAGNK